MKLGLLEEYKGKPVATYDADRETRLLELKMGEWSAQRLDTSDVRKYVLPTRQLKRLGIAL